MRAASRFLLSAQKAAAAPAGPLVKKSISPSGKVGILHMNRPHALNALNAAIAKELADRLEELDSDPSVGCIVLTGEGKAFVAGADIKEMAPKTFAEVYNGNLFGDLEKVRQVHKPIIAAVNGFALGGGCELAMMCDIVIASEKAVFGQPEIKLGTIPGLGGTQRLAKAIGKSKCMEWVLTGDQYTAEQAERAGLVSKVVPGDQLLDTAVKMADKIAGYSQPIVRLAKTCVNQAFEVGVTDGLAFEKRSFQSTFGTTDQKEGMRAFVEKRPPNFTHN
eukprot:TRINITY_DN21079_c0_g2_i1.p1 TRINITY_DN21079_c0_g2~~TRINITY_DN21079_c0_g2_i1.p1  ORF type:complete len:277 (+),score=77.54 TRINITY_DN21079_c0_g2_i1:46-876(+)